MSEYTFEPYTVGRTSSFRQDDEPRARITPSGDITLNAAAVDRLSGEFSRVQPYFDRQSGVLGLRPWTPELGVDTLRGLKLRRPSRGRSHRFGFLAPAGRWGIDLERTSGEYTLEWLPTPRLWALRLPPGTWAGSPGGGHTPHIHDTRPLRYLRGRAAS